LHGFPGPPGLKWGFWEGKIGEGMVRYLPKQIRYYFWGFLRLCQFCWKSIKKCDRESAHRGTDTHWQTQTDFI